MRRKASLARDHNAVLKVCEPFWKQLLLGHCVPWALVPAKPPGLEYHAQWQRESRQYRIEVTSRKGSVLTKWCPSFNEAVDTVTVLLLELGASCGHKTIEKLKEDVRTGERQILAMRNQLIQKEVQLDILKAWVGEIGPVFNRWERKP